MNSLFLNCPHALGADGRVRGGATYCSAALDWVIPWQWEYLPDSSIVVSGQGERWLGGYGTGQKVAQPGWLARFAAPCRRWVAGPLATTAAAVTAPTGPALWPQPATAGQPVPLAAPGAGGALVAHLYDAAGRRVATLAGSGTGPWALALPAELAPGLYWLRATAGGAAPAAAPPDGGSALAGVPTDNFCA